MKMHTAVLVSIMFTNISRADPLTIVNMFGKFDADAHSSLVSIMFTMLCPLWPWPKIKG